MSTNRSFQRSRTSAGDSAHSFSANLFGRLAQYYDPLHRMRDYSHEVGFVGDVFQKFRPARTSRTLELFCGTGGHSMVAARYGLDVVGLDLSPDMLEIARRKAASAKLSITFQQGDCRALAFDQDFDLVFGLGQSLHYLVEYRDIGCTLAGVHAALTDGGICVFDLINGWRMLEPHRVQHYDVLDDDTRILRIAHSQPNKARRVTLSEVAWIIQLPDGRLDLDRTEEEYRILFADELGYLLEAAGFETLGIFGDYTMDSCASPDCLVTIVVARKVGCALPVQSAVT
jgi:SAM-dependent methyltransferase